MTWMEEGDRDRLRAELARELQGPVELFLSAGEDGASRQALEVLQEIAELSPKLSLGVTAAGTALRPAIEVRGRARGRVGFLGLPTGYEFPTLLDAVRDVSRGDTSLSPALRARLSQLERDRRLRVFTTPT